jgi:hypothetical protein
MFREGLQQTKPYIFQTVVTKGHRTTAVFLITDTVNPTEFFEQAMNYCFCWHCLIYKYFLAQYK